MHLRKRNSMRHLRMLARKWKLQGLPLCIARPVRTVSMVRPVVNPMRSTWGLRGFWKPMHPQDYEWWIFYRTITNTILRGKDTIHFYDTCCRHFFFCRRPLNLPQRKQRWLMNGKNWKKIPAWTLTKVRIKKEVIDEARTSGVTVHFASLMDICHLKNAELETKHQKYKGRVVLRGDIVKDNSGSYAVFTEQGSSASQMTAAKIMDIISRLPGCDGQAADAVSAYTQVKMEDAHKLLKIPKSECPDIWIRLPRRKWPKSWSSMEDPVVLLEPNLYGHPLAGLLWERQFEKVLFETWMGENSKLGVSLCSTWKRVISVYLDDTKFGWKETKPWSDAESTQQTSRFGRTNIFHGSWKLGLHSKTLRNKQRYCGQWQNRSNREFPREKWRNYLCLKIFLFHHGLMIWWSCKVCGMILWVGRQDDSTTLQSIHSMHRWPPLQRRRNKICWRIVTCMLSNCAEMRKFYTNWTTWYSMVSEQTPRSWKKPRLVTKWVVWFLTSIRNVNKKSIPVWEALPNNADCVSRLRLCWRYRGLKFYCHTFVPISWISRKQTFVSHSSTES